MPPAKTAILAERIRQVRCRLFGDDEDGLIALAKALGLPAQTWENYENGVTMPATILLAFIQLTSTNPKWLQTGDGSADLAETHRRPRVASGDLN